MIEKTDAIVLRFHPFSNTSRIVTWLTPAGGRITTLVKGSQRPKSLFIGQYDLFYNCELVYYARDRAGVHIARECAPLKTRNRFRTDWKAAAAASYLSDLVYRISPPDAPPGGLFALLDGALDHLHEQGVSAPFVFWFELRLLRELGLAPRLAHCLECGKDLLPPARGSRFSYARGGILCPACAGGATDHSSEITPDIVAMLSGWQKADSPEAVRTTQCSPRQLGQLKHLLGLFLTYHLDTPLPSRTIAFRVLARGTAHGRRGENA